MARPKKQAREPFWFAARSAWYVTVGTAKVRLSADKEEAWRLWHEMMANGPAERAAPIPVAPSALTVEHACDLFLGWCRSNRAAKTYTSYRDLLQPLIEAIPARLAVVDLRPHHLTAVMDGREWSPNTKYDFVKTVKRALSWAVEQGYADRSPLERMKRPPIEARETVATPDDFQAVMIACNDPALRDLVELAWETGARPQELRAIEARHYRPEEGRFVLPPRESKGKRHHRVIYLGSDRAREIVERLAAENPVGPLLRNSRGEPWTNYAVGCAFKRLRVAMGEAIMESDGKPRPALGGRPKRVDPGRAARVAALAEWKAELAAVVATRVKPLHLGAFRKGYATEALKAGVDVIGLANLLGHRDATMLSRVYARPQQDPEYMAGLAGRAKAKRPKPS